MAMTLVPWGRNGGRNRQLPAELDPGGTFFTLHREMNRLFDDFFRGFDAPAQMGGGAGGGMTAGGWPRLEVEETQHEYRIHAELPGMQEKDVEALVEDGVLILRGEKRAQTEDKNRAFSERFYGRFERRIPLEGVDEDRIQAKFENGVLTITAPRTQQSREKARRIQIGGSGGQSSQSTQSHQASSSTETGQAAQTSQGESGQQSPTAH